MVMMTMKNIGRVVFLVFCISSPAFTGQPEKPPVAICCAGDSLMRPMPAYFRQLLPSDTPSFILYEWAQGGLNSVTYQSFYRQGAGRWRLATPDFILLQLGTNDVVPILEGRWTVADFKSNLAVIIREFQSYHSAAGKPPFILVATIPYFSDDPSNANKNRLVRDGVNPALREVVEREEVNLVDNFSVLEKKPELYDPDGVHPNALGEAALAKNWIRAMKSCLREKDR
jgi:lysophospholipase L1-like esterase